MSVKRSLSLVLITMTLALAFLSRVPSLFAAPQSRATNSVKPSPAGFTAAEFTSAIRQVAIAAMPDNDFQSSKSDQTAEIDKNHENSNRVQTNGGVWSQSSRDSMFYRQCLQRWEHALCRRGLPGDGINPATRATLVRQNRSLLPQPARL
jgi:hypothetical protein